MDKKQNITLAPKEVAAREADRGPASDLSDRHTLHFPALLCVRATVNVAVASHTLVE